MDLDDETLSAEEERFKTALHYTVGKLSEKAKEERMERERFRFAAQPSQCMPAEFTKEFIAALTDVTFDMIGHWGKDLEAFAKHAKRSMINADDVRLLCRHSPSLVKLLEPAPVVQDLNQNQDQPETTAHVPGENRKQATVYQNTVVIEDSNNVDAFDHEKYIDMIDDARSPVENRGTHNQQGQDDDLDDIIMMMDVDEVVGRSKGHENSFSSTTSSSYSKFASPAVPPVTKPKSTTSASSVYSKTATSSPATTSRYDETYKSPSNSTATITSEYWKTPAVPPATKPKSVGTSSSVYSSSAATSSSGGTYNKNGNGSATSTGYSSSSSTSKSAAVPPKYSSTTLSVYSKDMASSSGGTYNKSSNGATASTVSSNSSFCPKNAAIPPKSTEVNSSTKPKFTETVSSTKPKSNVPSSDQQVDEEEWGDFRMPFMSQVTMESIERRRRSAREKTEDNEFSLAGFDDKWWE